MPRHLVREQQFEVLTIADTNTLISALLRTGSVPDQAISKALSEGRLVFSAETLNEFDEVVSRPKFRAFISSDLRRRFRRAIVFDSPPIIVTTQIHLCRDPRDDKFLALARDTQAPYLITGDADLLALHPFESTHILTPRDFLELP